jgi:hypothetical protein
MQISEIRIAMDIFKRKLRFIFLFGCLCFTKSVFGQQVFVVNSLDDFEDVDLADGICGDQNGNCTLRAAIQNSNKYQDKDVIEFDIDGYGPYIICISSVLPKITAPVELDATTQEGFQIGKPVVVLDGSEASIYNVPFNVEKTAMGFELHVGSGGSSIKGFCIVNFKGSAIFIRSASNTIQANYLGLYVDGKSVDSNLIGIYALGGDNLIGGSLYGQRNYISGNRGTGIFSCTANWIIGNFIGTSADGKEALPNYVGIDLPRYSENNWISYNLISGNNRGISISGNKNRIIANRIGTDPTGFYKVANTYGIYLIDGIRNIIGGPAQGNQISGNQYGIYITNRIDQYFQDNFIYGNLIGTDAIGANALGNDWGIKMVFGNGNFIGGFEEGQRNIISGNAIMGMEMEGSFYNHVVNNAIGLEAFGENPLPNGVGISIIGNEKHGGSSLNNILSNSIAGNYYNGLKYTQAIGNEMIDNLIGYAHQSKDPDQNCFLDFFIDESSVENCIIPHY